MATEADVVLLIADLSGYTAFTEAHGALEAANIVTRYVEIAHGVLQSGVRVVERVGDELLIVAEEVVSAVRTANGLREAVEREPLFPMVRAGLHAGRVLEQDGRYFGTALNLAARVAAYARAGQILCTEQVVEIAPTLGDVEYRRVGPVRFKNIVDPVMIFEIIAGRTNAETGVVDPVCRMQVRPDTAPARLPFGGTTYYFCSFHCAKAFIERPDAYLRT